MWPAAQTQRWIFAGSSMPARTAGTKSASSTQLWAAAKTSGASFRQCQIFDQNHSEEYVPPIGARYCGACSAAIRVMAAASSAPVWSFQSQAWAARFALHFGSRASGRPFASTGIGVEPVVSTPRPITSAREKPGCFSAAARAPFTEASRPAT